MPAPSLDGFVQAGQQAARRAVQQDGQDQEAEVDDIEVQAGAAHDVVVEHVGQPARGDQPGQQPAVLQARGRTLVVVRGRHRGLFQARRIDIDAFLLVGQHQPVDQRHEDEHRHHDHQVEYRENRIAGGNDADLVGGEMPLGRDGQRNRAGQTAVPDDEAGIGAGHQQPVIDPHLAGDLLGEQRAHHQPEAPVDPAGGQRHHADQDDRPAGAGGQAGQPRQHPLDQRRAGQHVAGDQHQQHLHRESQQPPEAVAPPAHDGHGGLAFDDHGRAGGDQRQQHHEYVRVGQIALNHFHG